MLFVLYTVGWIDRWVQCPQELSCQATTRRQYPPPEGCYPTILPTAGQVTHHCACAGFENGFHSQLFVRWQRDNTCPLCHYFQILLVKLKIILINILSLVLFFY